MLKMVLAFSFLKSKSEAKKWKSILLDLFIHLPTHTILETSKRNKTFFGFFLFSYLKYILAGGVIFDLFSCRTLFVCRDLDESLQKAFLKYLAARGIKGSLYNFLHEYMMTKEDKEYVVWLKNLKEFVAK